LISKYNTNNLSSASKEIKSGRRPKAKKGRVREAMLNLLAQQPYSLTDLSRILKVSKPTISYHLYEFSNKGIIEGAGVKAGKGVMNSKLYVLKKGVDYQIPSTESDHYYLEQLSGIYEDIKLEWTSDENIKTEEIAIKFLYQLFRILRHTTRTRHHDILFKYGFRTGNEIISKSIKGNTLSERLESINKYMKKTNLANLELTRGQEAYHANWTFECLGCFNARENGGPVCSFTKGVIEGILTHFFNRKYSLSDRRIAGAEYKICNYQVIKTKKSMNKDYSGL